MVVTDRYEYLCEEENRLKEDRERKKYWKQFGSYVHISMNPNKTLGLITYRCPNDNGLLVGITSLLTIHLANVCIH